MNDLSRIRILVADDDPDIRHSTARVLENAGYTVFVAKDGDHALAAAQEHRPDLVLLDRDMPGLDGIEVCRRFKRNPLMQDRFIVLASGSYTQSDEQAEGLEAGADAYITRPIENRELLARVSSFIRIQQLTHSLREQAYQLREQAKELQEQNEILQLQRMASLNLMQDAIADRERVEEVNKALRESRARLVQAQKMEAIGRLAGGVAHDFNNMLMGIMGNAELCREFLPDDHPISADLDEIMQCARRSTELTGQLLAFARKQTINPTLLDLNDEITGMLKMLRRLLGEHIDLAWIPEADLWPVKTDASQLAQVLTNLTVNARDAIEDIGKMTIETARISLQEDDCKDLTDAIPGEYVMLAVSDNGMGMDAETRSHLFEPFFTTKDVGRGTGLGLATIYGIIKQNGGFIHVYSEPDQGSTFRLYLPRNRDGVKPETSVRAAPTSPSGTENILVVEDEKAIRSITKRLLESLGYRVTIAASPTEAIQVFAARQTPYDLLLTDIVMPGMNGRDLAEKLLVEQPNLHVLYMSGYTANVIAHLGVLDPGVNFISKPFTREVLAHTLRQILTPSTAESL